MRKLVESTFVTLDGVIGEPQEWGPPYWDDEHAGYARGPVAPRTRCCWAGTPTRVSPKCGPSSGGEYAGKLNSMPKYVASRTLEETTWNATLLEGDAAESVAELKQQPGGDILKYGTGELDHALMENDLVDEFHFWVFPVIAGGGERLLEGFDLTHLQLVARHRSRAASWWASTHLRRVDAAGAAFGSPARRGESPGGRTASWAGRRRRPRSRGRRRRCRPRSPRR